MAPFFNKEFFIVLLKPGLLSFIKKMALAGNHTNDMICLVWHALPLPMVHLFVKGVSMRLCASPIPNDLSQKAEPNICPRLTRDHGMALISGAEKYGMKRKIEESEKSP